ncbi:MAG TPA: hypothetical protein VFR84_02035 [Candidatus Angelobacter sp.]|nr:hypothetical protein [Candidatus Angelobacter sp.]
MRDLVVLVVVVVLVYLLQCICWAPARAQVFVLEAEGPGRSHPIARNTGVRWGPRRKRGFLWSALKLSGYWANPLPPLQPLVVSEWPEFELSAEALRVQAEAEPAPWEQVTLTRLSGKLLVNGSKIFQGGADPLRSYEELLLSVKRAKVKDRPKLIAAWLKKVTDAEAARLRLEAFTGQTGWLELAANLQFFLLFAMTPLAFYRFGSKALWPVLGVVLATSVVIAWKSGSVHKKFFPADGEARFKTVFGALLSPIHAIRALDSLAHHLLDGFHPVAVAGAICSKEEFEAFAGEQLRAMAFSHAGKNWYSGQLQAALESTLQKKGLSPQQVLAAPERDGGCVQYCPRCRAQYTKAREDCADCGFAPLKDFGETAAQAKQTVAISRT